MVEAGARFGAIVGQCDQDAKTQCNRIAAFDLMETVAIFMACSLHYPLFIEGSLVAEIWQLLCMGAVPAFFMINGCLLLSKPLILKKHFHKIINVVLGIFIWKTVILAVFSCLGIFDSSVLNPAVLTGYYLTAGSLGNLPTAHIWFMYALLSIYIVFPFFKIAFDKGYKQYIITLIVFGVVCIPLSIDVDWLFGALSEFTNGAISIDLRISQIMMSLFPFGAWGIYLVYFLLGPFAWKQIEISLKAKGPTKTGLMALALLFVCICFALLQDYIYQGSFTWTGSVIPDQYKHLATTGIAVALLAASASARIPGIVEQFVTFISRNTLTVYYAHSPILLILTLYFVWPQGFAFSCVRTFFVVVVGALFGLLLKKIPFLRRIA